MTLVQCSALLFTILVPVAAPTAGSGADQQLRIEQHDKKLVVHAKQPGSSSWRELATYVTDPQLRPYFHPLYDATGRQALTEDRPADHPWQHGIFTGFHRVNGYNYWKEDEGRHRFVEIRDFKQAAQSVAWTAVVELVSPQGEIVLEEQHKIRMQAPRSDGSYAIDFSLILKARDQDVQFGKFFVGGLSVRMPWDKENPRHQHLNSTGLRGRTAEQQRAAWCNVERPFGDGIHGIAIFDHPANPNHPPSWRVDEQGLINPNVSGLADWSLRAGEKAQFNYRILVRKGSATPSLLENEYRSFAVGD